MNKDYILREVNENVWEIVDIEVGNTIDTITKDIVINYCKNEFEDGCTDCMSVNYCAECVWDELDNDYNFDSIDNYGREFDKFIAWFEYVCIEYCAKELVAFYKQRLLYFE